MSFSRIVFLSSVCLTVLCAAAPSRAESLDQAVAAAISDHPSVAAAQANRAALGEAEKEKRSDYFPQLSTEATGGRIYGDNATSRGLSVTRGAGYSGYGEGSVNLSQRLFDGFETSNRVGAARARRDSADFAVADAQEDVAMRATLAYLDVLRGQESLAELQKYGKTIDSYIGRIEKMVKEGGADATLREQARDIRAQLDNTVASSQGQLQVAIATYTELIGHPPDAPMVKPVPPLDAIPGSAAEAIAYAHDHHPTLKAAALNEQAAALDNKAEQSAYYPALSGQLSYLKSDEKDLLGGELIDARAVVKMDWNYALGGAEQARVHKAEYQRAQTAAQAEDLNRQIARRIAVAYSDNQTAEDQARIQRQRVSLNEGLFGTQKQQFEGGKVNLLQLLQSDNSLFNARLALLNDEYRALGAKYTILASMGRLQEVMKSVPPQPAIPAHSAAPVMDTAPPKDNGRTAVPAVHAETLLTAPAAKSDSLLSTTPTLVAAPSAPASASPDVSATPAPGPLVAPPGEASHPAMAPVPDQTPPNAQ